MGRAGEPSPVPRGPVVAVVPFGAVADGADAARAGRWARQIARRLVERFAAERALELRPVFLVALPEGASEAGYLVFGSAPDEKLAGEYGRSLGATHALTGTYRETRSGRAIDVALVDVAAGRRAAGFARAVAAGELHLLEPALARWLASALGATVSADLATPVAANEEGYGALLEGMDCEVDATLLADSDAGASERATLEAAARYARSLRADPTAEVAEQRLLVIAAGAVEREDHRALVPVLERAVEARSASWRLHFLLGELRRLGGDASGAIVAFEHADALQPLRPADSLTLAQLHIASGATAVASSRLRRIVRGEADPAVKGTARRLLLGLRHPELEKDLEEAGRVAVEGDPGRAGDADARLARVLEAEPDIWEAHFGRGMLAWQRGDTAAAHAAFRRAVDLNPAAAGLLSGVWKPTES